MTFSENVLRYSEENVRTAHITTTYSWVNLKTSLVILSRQYILLTLLLLQLGLSGNVLSYSGETVFSVHITSMHIWFCMKLFVAFWRYSIFCARY